MLPYFQLGPWTVYTYAFLYALMYLMIGVWGFLRLRRLPYPLAALSDVLLTTIFAVVVGSLLPTLWASFALYFETGYWVRVGNVRLLIGMAAGILAAVFTIRKNKLPLGKVFDMGILPFPAGMVIGRLGCFAAGCCYGVATDSWIGMDLRDITGAWYVRYPTQLMAAAGDLAIFLVLAAVEAWKNRREKEGKVSPIFDGALVFIFVFLYCLKRLFLQFLRYDYAPRFGPLDTTQLICLAGLIITAFVLVKKTHAHRSPKTI